LIRPAGLGQISHPFDTMVVTFFEHLQKPHDQPRSGKHKHLEIDIDRWSSPDLTGRRAGKLCSRVECELLAPLDPRDSAKASFMVDRKRSTVMLTSRRLRFLLGHTSLSPSGLYSRHWLY
jgi:hypothetical protein